MKRVIGGVIGILSLLGVTVVAGPEMRLSESEFNFGYAPQSSKVAHDFWIHSVGDQNLKIVQVVPGCGCTQAPLESDLIAPGDSARLEIIFDTQRYSHRVLKRPAIEIEGDPAPHQISIISYVVTRPDSTYPLMMSPYKFDISQFGNTVRDRATIKITNVSSRELSFKLIDGATGWGQLTLPDKIGPEATVEVDLVLEETVLDQSFEKSITFEVDDEPGSRYSIPVRRRMRNPEGSPQADPTGAP